MKYGPKPNNKKMRILVVLKTENQNLTRKTTKKIQFYFSRRKSKKKLSFVADNKLQVDQIGRKMVQSSISH